MNDPNLDKPISKHAHEVEREQNDSPASDGVEDEQAYIQPSRWWFASTAFPLLAGTFGPMASAFNVCALVATWRVTVGPGESEDNGKTMEDPAWVIASNAVSLVIAIVANLALLFNMAQRVKFEVAQPITIVGWYLSSFILIGLVTAIETAPSLQLSAEQNPRLTQAFYYAIMSAVLYIIVASLMLVTVFGAYKGHYPKKFELTMSQRTLMVQTISLLVYILSGAAVFSRIEDWLFLNGVYWATTTLLTVGTGDFSPKSHTGQSLLFPYAFGGIVILGLVIGSIRSLILERGKIKISARLVEKKRERLVKQWHDNGRLKVTAFHSAHNLDSGLPELERREKEFHAMRLVQEYSDTSRKWISLTISATAWFTLWLVGAVVFWRAERLLQGMTYFEAVYFCYVSLLTVGYGDYYPIANSSKAFFVFWSLLAVPTLTILISNMGDTVVKFIRNASLWAAEVTVFQRENSVKNRMTEAFKQRSIRRLFRLGSQQSTHKQGTAATAVDELGKDLERDELEKVKQSVNKLDESRHVYHYLLVHQIRLILKDVAEDPPKKYSYDEWKWFLRLLGQDEEDGSFHRMPPKEPGKFSRGVDENQKWSWLGERSPLLGEQNEANWVLERLTVKLEKLLLEEKRRNKGYSTSGPK